MAFRFKDIAHAQFIARQHFGKAVIALRHALKAVGAAGCCVGIAVFIGKGILVIAAVEIARLA